MSNTKIASWLLRIGIAGTFFGHGIFGIMGSAGWIKYFNAVGIIDPTAITFIKLIGLMDIIIAITVLVKPIRIVLLWAAIWAFIAAIAKYNAGASILDVIERFTYWAAPLALFALQGPIKKLRDLFKA